MSLVISKLEASHVAGLWPYIEAGVKEIHRLSGGSFGWGPLDVRAALEQKKALACFVYFDKERVGFFILRFFEDEFSRKKYVHVWLAYQYPDFHPQSDLMIEVWDWIENEARKLGARYIEWDSNRAAWQKRAVDLGAKPHRTVYRKEL